MENIKFKKPSNRIAVNGLVRNDRAKVKTLNGSELTCKVVRVSDEVYTCEVLNKNKASKDNIYPGDLIDFTIDDVYEVTRYGSADYFKTLKELKDMLDSDCSNEEILRKAEKNLERDFYVFHEKMLGQPIFFNSIWDSFMFNNLRDINICKENI